jgi:hypothetical protein
MKKLNDAQITAKSVEISKCLVNTSPALVNYDLGITQSIGDAARLAVSIKRLQDRIQRSTIAGVSSALKIDFRIAESKIIPLYEALGWITDLRKTGNKVDSFIEQIPPPEDILSLLGKNWREQEPTIVEQATVFSLSQLSQRPYSRDALVSDLEIDQNQFEIMFDYGEQVKNRGQKNFGYMI